MSSQRDSERALIAKERRELAEMPADGAPLMTNIYKSRKTLGEIPEIGKSERKTGRMLRGDQKKKLEEDYEMISQNSHKSNRKEGDYPVKRGKYEIRYADPDRRRRPGDLVRRKSD